MPLEACCRVMALHQPSVGFYRPHNNPVMEYFQYHGRNRNNRYMIGKREVKALFKALADNECCLYLPDQDYGPKRSIFVPFFAVKETATTTGTLMFAEGSGAPMLIAFAYRDPDTQDYVVEIHDVLDGIPSGDAYADLTRLNQEIEKFIRRQPAQYLWAHRRFKTRPQGQPSLYEDKV